MLFGLLAIFGVTAIALFTLCNMSEDNSTVNHYDLQSVEYAKDEHGNWQPVSITYKKH